MSDVILSSGVRANLNSLQTTSNLLQSTQKKLATGKRVNSALDNPTNFFTSQSLNSRANDLSALQDGISNAIKTIEAADNGIKAITKLVESAQSTARQALQAATDNVTTITGSGQVSTNSSPVTSGDIPAKVAGQTLGNLGLDVNDTIELSVTTAEGAVNTYSYTVSTTDTVQDFIDDVNNSGVASASITNDGKLSFSVDGGDSLTLTITENTDGSSASVQNAGVFAALGFGGNADLDQNSNATLTDAGDIDVTFTNGTTAADADVLTIAAAAVGTDTASTNAELTAQYNEILSQIDDLARDASFNGTNLINSSEKLTVAFNEKRDGTNKSELEITGKDLTSSGLSLTSASGLTKDEANDKLDQLSDALDSLRKAGSTFGSQLNTVKIREEFNNDLVNTLQTGADSLVIADTNEEGARLLALQTRQSLSSTALSLASQADQNVLRLF